MAEIIIQPFLKKVVAMAEIPNKMVVMVTIPYKVVAIAEIL